MAFSALRFAFLFFLVLTGSVLHAESSVLFDEGHRQVFRIENSGELDLNVFAETLREEGLSVGSTKGSITPARLEGVDCLIISGPFAPVTPSERVAIVDFVQKGGRLAVMLHIAQPLAPLMMDLGVMHSNGIIREQVNRIQEAPTDFYATRKNNHQILDGLERFALYGVWAIQGTRDDIKGLAVTSPHGWVDLNKDGKLTPGDAMQELNVVVAGEMGAGEFVVFGDDAIFQNRFLHEENEKLARNLAHWISQDKGDK